jgi:hypothetical protein
MRSPTGPRTKGEKSEPTHASAAIATRSWTEPVSASTYQPRISSSLSNAQEVARSAGHWNRKLRTPNGRGTAKLSAAPKGCARGPYRRAR